MTESAPELLDRSAPNFAKVVTVHGTPFYMYHAAFQRPPILVPTSDGGRRYDLEIRMSLAEVTPPKAERPKRSIARSLGLRRPK